MLNKPFLMCAQHFIHLKKNTTKKKGEDKNQCEEKSLKQLIFPYEEPGTKVSLGSPFEKHVFRDQFEISAMSRVFGLVSFNRKSLRFRLEQRQRRNS